MQVLFHFNQSFHCDFSSSSPPCEMCDRKQKRTLNILFTLLKRGDENNIVRLVSVSVHDIYSSAFLSRTLFSLSSFRSPLPLPNIIPCHSQRENLIALINKVSWDRQIHRDSEREACRHSKNNNVKYTLNTSLSVSATPFNPARIYLGLDLSQKLVEYKIFSNPFTKNVTLLTYTALCTAACDVSELGLLLCL